MRVTEKRPKVPDESKRGLVLLFTGNGKGKTTAALGILLRAFGHQMKCVMLSFIKSTTQKYGEHKAVEKMEGVDIIQLGDGFTWLSENIEIDKALAETCWKKCEQALSDDSIKIVILDEITYPILYGWLDVDKVIAALRNRPMRQHVVITGRDAHEKLIELADTATEMRPIKHAFDKGIIAAKGIEL